MLIVYDDNNETVVDLGIVVEIHNKHTDEIIRTVSVEKSDGITHLEFNGRETLSV